MATAVSFNSITVTWSEPSMPNGEIRRYNITYYETNDESSNSITLEVSDVLGRTQQLMDLDPFTNYTIIIHAFTGAGIGQPSDPVTVQTDETGINHSLQLVYGTQLSAVHISLAPHPPPPPPPPPNKKGPSPF